MEILTVLVAVGLIWLQWRLGFGRVVGWLAMSVVGAFLLGILSARGLMGRDDADDW